MVPFQSVTELGPQFSGTFRRDVSYVTKMFFYRIAVKITIFEPLI